MAKTSHVQYVPGKFSKDGKKRTRDFYEVYCDDIDSPTKAFYKRSRLLDIPTWVYNEYLHCIDVMHVEKNVTEHLADAFLDLRRNRKIMCVLGKLWRL